jgi:hypothetical protein
MISTVNSVLKVRIRSVRMIFSDAEAVVQAKVVAGTPQILAGNDLGD